MVAAEISRERNFHNLSGLIALLMGLITRNVRSERLLTRFVQRLDLVPHPRCQPLLTSRLNDTQ